MGVPEKLLRRLESEKAAVASFNERKQTEQAAEESPLGPSGGADLVSALHPLRKKFWNGTFGGSFSAPSQ